MLSDKSGPMAIHPRNKRYKERILTAPYEICIERARYYTESFRESEGEHPALRAARAFAYTLGRMSIHILDEEEIVGNRTGKLVAAGIPVERGEVNTVLDFDLDLLLNRERQPFHISPEEKRELVESILPYWKGKTLRDRKNALMKENGLYFKPSMGPLSIHRRRKSLDMARIKEFASVPKKSMRYIFKLISELLYNNPALVMNVFDVQGHLILGHNNILREGFAGVRERAKAKLIEAENAGDAEGKAFLESVIICCDAVRDYAARFADKAEKMADESDDEKRSGELRAIAERCRRVPFHTPRDFREAVQALWLTEVGALIAYGMTGIFAVGRIDRYLYPFYAKDKAEGRISDDEVVQLLEELLIKFSSNLLILPYSGKNTGNELGSDSCAPTVGGLDPDGSDAVNELSHLVLDAFANIKSLGNSFMIRLSEKSPESFWRKALSTYRHTSGAALFSDETVIEALKTCGMSERDARDYGLIGCVEPTGEGNTFGCTSGNDISLAAALEMTLLNGRLHVMGRRIGPKTGDPRGFGTFDNFMDAFKRQVEFMVRSVVKAVNLKDSAYMEAFPSPYVSATISGCIENARDLTAGGALYNFGSVSARGMGTAVDSLAAVKRFVYDRKSISMERLLKMINTNFRNEEIERRRLAARGPKYGSDDDYADDIAREVVDHFCREVASHRCIRGGPFRPGFFSYGMHVYEGLILGATPNGRRAGEPVSNSFSPSNGSERKGPTAMLRSVSKSDHGLISNGCAVNIKLPPSMLEGEERLDKMVALVKGYFALGGMELSPNVVSNETLKDAQKHPENHIDLVVRVSGYSALFCDLGRPLQDEIINRTEFNRL